MKRISTRNGIFITIDALRPDSVTDLIVYLGETSLRPAEVVSQIKSFLEDHLQKIDSICLIAPRFREAPVLDVLHCDEFVQLQARYGVASDPFLFERDGGIIEIDAVAPDRRPRMLRRILTSIVHSRHGVLGASVSVHYAKPSRKHTGQFIRTGNVLVNSVEVELIAWGCLTHVPDQVAFVYTDTGAINVLACAVRDLLFGFGKAAAFSVDSFGSYKGLETFAGRREGSIWLISGTTSGDLAREIIDKQAIDPRKIVTLFSLGVPTERSVCHLDYDEEHNPDGFRSFQSYEPNNCALCRNGSTPLWLTDEHFLVSDIAVTAYLPRRDDLPRETRSVLHDLVGEKVFRVFYQPNQHTELSDIFLDFEPHVSDLLATSPAAIPKLAQRFRRRVEQSLPAGVDAVVYLDDPASHALASSVSAHFSHRGLTPTLVAASKLETQEFASPPNSIVVVASTVASGTSVIDLSRTLRAVNSVKSITYLVLVDRSATEARSSQTSQSVTMTDDSHRYDYHVIAKLPLPDPTAVTTNSWDDEIRLLEQLLENVPDDSLRGALEARKDLLGRAKDRTQRGLSNDLFWPSANRSALGLSSGFVFLPSEFDAKRVSQADVYGVIRCLLHSLRTKGKEGQEPPLRQHPLHRKVLDVGVFYRFNDPVLQAAFLRAAAPAELDYSNADIGNQSASARLLLMRTFKNPAAPATEFALALAAGRIRITEEDKKQVLAEIETVNRSTLGNVTLAFLDAWRSDYASAGIKSVR